jgi:hypothetical protein
MCIIVSYPPRRAASARGGGRRWRGRSFSLSQTDRWAATGAEKVEGQGKLERGTRKGGSEVRKREKEGERTGTVVVQRRGEEGGNERGRERGGKEGMVRGD